MSTLLVAAQVAAITSAVLVAAQAAGPDPTAGEMAAKRAWLKKHLLEAKLGPAPAAQPAPALPIPSLEVLANNDPVIPNARGPRPLTLGEKQYHRGLYCHAISRVVVRLPAPARAFSAIIGVDSNDQTSGGRGSVIFSVTAGGKRLFQSEVMRENTPARPVSVDLAGADTFLLEVGDAGDGIACDQSDWAEAKVTLADGKELWLGDLPILDHRPEASAALPARSSELPFSFTYGGRPSDAVLAGWPKKTATKKLDRARTQHTFAWADPDSGLEVRCVAVEYADFPVVEWTTYFRNAGNQNTPLLENLQGLDTQFERRAGGEFLLHHWKGDTCAPDLYQPLETELAPNARLRLAPAGGRGSNGAFPYYDLQMRFEGAAPSNAGGGVMLAVGWPGQWATTFTRDGERGLRVTAGQELTRLTLKPGEQVRTPLIALLFWQGDDTVRAQNLWRRWMWAHNVPRTADGKLPPSILFGNTSGEFNEMLNANEENQKAFIDRYREERVPIDFWWMDAGWYPCQGQWWNTGTWEPDPARFPRGLRAISDHAHALGIKTLVWFEPERVNGDNWISKNHPEWVLGGRLLDLGNPEVLQWLTDHVDKVLTEQGISLYRQDFNTDPLDVWRAHDAPDRQGMTENLHVQNYLAYWDALRKRHPGLIIDSCASGGRRNDLETMRRAIALHPTDYNYGDLPVKQAFHYSLFQWLPDFGSNTVPCDTVDPYAYRSGHAVNVVLGYDFRRKELDYDALRRLASEWREIVPCYRGDFYPLTPYSIGEAQWIAWQFDRPKEGDGVVEAFRRAKCDDSTRTFRLAGLQPGARYEVTNLDAGAPAVFTGKELTEKGLPVEISKAPGAAVVRYRRVK